MLSACASFSDAPRLGFDCPRGLRFEARLYQDMALLDGLSGHAVLERLAAPGAMAAAGAEPLVYADPTVRAQFGLGVGGRLVRLDYTGIPEPVTCERRDAGARAEPPHAHARAGPRPPPPPPDPNAPVETNIHLGDGRNGPG